MAFICIKVKHKTLLFNKKFPITRASPTEALDVCVESIAIGKVKGAINFISAACFQGQFCF